jgi:hypothetical protein
MTEEQIQTGLYVVICLIALIALLAWYAFKGDGKDGDF